MLELLHKYLDSKGKQAKLKSPNELQVGHRVVLAKLSVSVMTCRLRRPAQGRKTLDDAHQLSQCWRQLTSLAWPGPSQHVSAQFCDVPIMLHTFAVHMQLEQI